jgi:hypothetical protein
MTGWSFRIGALRMLRLSRQSRREAVAMTAIAGTILGQELFLLHCNIL